MLVKPVIFLTCSGDGESKPNLASSTEEPLLRGASLSSLSLADLNRELCFAEAPGVWEKSRALSSMSTSCSSSVDGREGALSKSCAGSGAFAAACCPSHLAEENCRHVRQTKGLAGRVGKRKLLAEEERKETNGECGRKSGTPSSRTFILSIEDL